MGDIAPVGGTLAAIAGIAVLLGWALNVELLKSTFPGLLTMKANTAVCFVLMGSGVALLSRTGKGTLGRSVALAAVAAAVAIALVIGAQYVVGADFGVDQLLFREPAGAVGTLVSGRMSPFTVVSFTLLGVAALAGPRARRLVIAFGGVVLTACALGIFNYLLQADIPSAVAGVTQMAVNTSVAMGILSLAVVGLLGAANPLAALAGRSATAVLLRWVLLGLMVVPVVTVWLVRQGQERGLYDSSYGTSLSLIAALVISVVAILYSARWANRVGAQRETAELERDMFFELSLDLMTVVGENGQLRRVNGAWETALGYRPQELIGKQMFDYVHPDDRASTIAESLRDHAKGEPVHRFRNRYRHQDGSYRWFEWMSQAAPDRSVRFGVARDVTAQKGFEESRFKRQRALEVHNAALSEQALRDPVTGLHNRRFFDEEVVRMERRWSEVAGARGPVCVIMFDLDHFGDVNNQYGHQAGDAVLRHFGGLLKERFREGDLIARYGGEEFVAVLDGAHAADAVRIAEGIRAALEDAPADIGTGSPIRVTVSAGCASLGEDVNIAAGLFLADVLLAQAKRAGRNRVIGQ